MRLYELSENYNNLYDLLENEEVPVEVIEEALKEIEDELENKFDSIAALIKIFEGKVQIFKQEEDRLSSRRRVYNNKIKELKDYILDQLEFTERNKVEGDRFTVRKQRSPKSIEVFDQQKLDEKYLLPQKPKVNSKAIREDLKAGKTVDGATYKPDSYHVRIQ